ncbi:hypothetical protein ACFL1G_08300 [Planctomycetota bacterium]
MNKKTFALTIFLTIAFMNNLNAQSQVLDWKVLSNKQFNCSDISQTTLFIDNDNNAFVLIGIMGENRFGNNFLYMNSNWVVVDKYGILLNGFIKDGSLQLAFKKDEEIVIYKVQKDIMLAHRIKIMGVPQGIDPSHSRVISVSEQNSSNYFLKRCVKLPANPVERLRTILSGGHGIYYKKPCLSEIQDDKMLKYQKIRYGGKIDESYVIEEVATGKDLIHFLGFRMPEEAGTQLVLNETVVLHYAGYDVKKKKIIRKHSIYENIPKYDRNTDTNSYYGQLSIDGVDDDVFVVFSWVEKKVNIKKFNIKEVKSDIYYCRLYNNSFGDIEKIANGFLPLVKIDFVGNVHVI